MPMRGQRYQQVGRDHTPGGASEGSASEGVRGRTYEVKGVALESIKAAARNEWTHGRVVDQTELDESTAVVFNQLVRTAFEACRPAYTVKHMRALSSA